MRRVDGTRMLAIAIVSLIVALLASPTPDFLTVGTVWVAVLLLGLLGSGVAGWLRRHSGNGR